MKIHNEIDKLLVEFDEMGFAPTNLCDDTEGTAKLWKSKLIYELGLLLDEYAAIRKKSDRRVCGKMQRTHKRRLCKRYVKQS